MDFNLNSNSVVLAFSNLNYSCVAWDEVVFQSFGEVSWLNLIWIWFDSATIKK
jgi:hypothetical protein